MHRRLVVRCILLLMAISVGFTSMAQAIIPLEPNTPTLVALTADRPIAAYEFTNPDTASYTVALQFLGTSAPVRVEWYNAAGIRIATTSLMGSGETGPQPLPAELLTLLVIAESGSATARLTLLPVTPMLAPPPLEATPTATPPFETEGMGEDTIRFVESGVNTGMPIPLSGAWLANWVTVDEQCPADLPVSEAWLTDDGSAHVLTFGDESTLALDIHRVVASIEIDETPEFFYTENEEIGTFVVIPGIQTEPYFYLYRVVDAGFITLDYFQTLALSDCELYISVELQWMGDESVIGPDGTLLSGAGGSGQGGPGEPDPTFAPVDPADADACGQDAISLSGPDWFFDVPGDVLSQAAYGRWLSFEVRLLEGEVPSLIEVEMVANNQGVVYGATVDPAFSNTEWTTRLVPLDAGAFLENYFMQVNPLQMQFHMRTSVDRLLVLGTMPSTGTVCVRNIQIRSL